MPNTPLNTPFFDDAELPIPPRRRSSRATKVTEARANAQRKKIEDQRAERVMSQPQDDAQGRAVRRPQKKSSQATSLAWAFDAYIQDHIGGNRSEKTIE